MPITSSVMSRRLFTSVSRTQMHNNTPNAKHNNNNNNNNNSQRKISRLHSCTSTVFSSVMGSVCYSGRSYATVSQSSKNGGRVCGSPLVSSSSSSSSSGWRQSSSMTAIGVMCCAATMAMGVSLFWSHQQKREFTRIPAKLIKPARSSTMTLQQQAAEYGDESLLFGLEDELDQQKDNQAFYLTSAAACKSKASPVISAIGPSDIEHHVSEDEIDGCDCGEDSFFLVSSRNISAIGVADGVGGWTNMGVNPKEFSYRLMKNCLLEFNAAEESPNSNKNVPAIGVSDALPSALDALSAAYQKIHVERQVVAGSSTACIVVLDGQEKALNFANIGDSAFMLVRDGRILIRSKEQQHAFNAPFQLGIIPQQMKSSNSLDNKPSDADTARNARIAIKEGDIIIMGTDGLFDNVFDREVIQVLSSCGNNLQQVARKLVMFASECVARNRDGPFAHNARANGYAYRGAKPDDVTVIVARVDVHQYSPDPSMREPNQIPATAAS